MATSEPSVGRYQGIGRRQVVLTAAAVAAAAVAAALIIRQRRQRQKDAYDARGSAAGGGRAAADGASAAEAQPGAGSTPSQAADGAASTADQATAPRAAAAAEQQAWNAVSTLHAGGRVHRGTNPRWCWSEDEADVIVETAASGASSARDISVKFQPRHLALSVCGEQIIDGDLPNAVHADECSWQFEGSGKDRRVVLTLVKALAAIRWDQMVLGSSA